MKKLLFLLVCAAFIFTGCVDGTTRDSTRPSTDNGAVTTNVSVTGTTLTPAEIFEYNADAVFTIYTSFDNEYFFVTGSGFFVDSTGVAVTNHHVIVGWPYAFIRTHSGREYDISGYYSYDLNNDLAVIQVAGRRFPYLLMGDSGALRIGESVYAIGSPLGYHNTFSAGLISRFDHVAEFDIYRVYGMIQFTAPISGGSSGGALLNNMGEVIGITTAAYGGEFAQAINFAVPIRRVDLTSAGGNYNQLPLGEMPTLDYYVIIGEWDWWGGYYRFAADGTGSRSWDGIPDTFIWHVQGIMIVLEFEDYLPERWTLSVTNENEIIIGGAFFTRVDPSLPVVDPPPADPPPADPPAVVPPPITQTPAQALTGIWTWGGGHYIFDGDGTGSRVWNNIPATFQWHFANDFLVLDIPGADTERYEVEFISDTRITIGGALFSRTNTVPGDVYVVIPPPPPVTGSASEVLIGSWSWSGGWYDFYDDGTGSRNWDGVFADFEWRMSGSTLILSFDNGWADEQWGVVVINDNEVTVGGALFERGS